MVKEGPCCHCGVTSTPLWRNGPPDKPVLCNACGSRWRTKGTLANYTPMHLRGEPQNFVDYRVARNSSSPLGRSKDVKPLKRKRLHENEVVLGITPDNSQSFSKVTLSDDDLSNRSSSGSAISNSESYAQFGSADASDLTDPAQSVVWDTSLPSRKRSCVIRSKPSAVEKLTKDLYTILQEQQSSCFSGSTEEDLLLECDTPMEMGHGSALIIHPSSIGREEESEASSLSINNKRHKINDVDSRAMTPVVHNKDTKLSTFPRMEKMKVPSQENEQGYFRREKFEQEKFHLLGSPHSPLLSIELKDVVNFEVFMKQLTSEEQIQLLKYLPAVDTAKSFDSLRGFFTGPEFLESMGSFQHLLAEGVFDGSPTGEMGEDRKMLKWLALFDLTKFKWIQHYRQVKDQKIASSMPCSEGPSRPKINVMKKHQVETTKGVSGQQEAVHHDNSYFGPRSLFAVPGYNANPPKPDSFYISEETFDPDQDLLLEVPSNSSFPQAELLRPAPSSTISQQASNNSSSCSQHPSDLR
ncbi:hypothetical protein MLD38_036505 [Melastoma candidum]|uniref:Uncharacterized protein n=1 Tax=Melastoma candidum TaxID=119954 RepID=A0ACB9LKG7_9MYRT|nr:hypothetical protein MLD38_036505 [Melastoma candidum]